MLSFSVYPCQYSVLVLCFLLLLLPYVEPNVDVVSFSFNVCLSN